MSENSETIYFFYLSPSQSQILFSVCSFFSGVDRYSQECVSELCRKNAVLYSACCNKANRKKEKYVSEFVLFSKSMFSREEFFSVLDGTFF